jgi:NhaP-type Na+/H+ or K+/H+ antiporter
MGYSLLYVLENLLAALLVGLFIGYVYRKTHRDFPIPSRWW